MANEISISISITAAKGGAQYQRSIAFNDDMAGDSWETGIMEIAATDTTITDTQVGNYGWLFLKNCGTNPDLYIDFAHDAAALSGDDTICRLYGGESCILKSAGETNLHAISSTGVQNCEYAIIEL